MRHCVPLLLLLTLELAAGDRRLLACSVGCLRPLIAADAVASSPTFINLKFRSPYFNYRTPATGYAVAYSICALLECNYRNVTALYVAGDDVNKDDIVLNVTFYSPPGADVTALPASLIAALPSDNVVDAGGLLYYLTTPVGGSLPSASSVSLGWGQFHAPPAGPLPPAPPEGYSPPPPLPPPSPPFRQPPTVPPPPKADGGLAVGVVLLLLATGACCYACWHYYRAGKVGGDKAAAKRRGIGRAGFADLDVEASSVPGGGAPRPRTRAEGILLAAVR